MNEHISTMDQVLMHGMHFSHLIYAGNVLLFATGHKRLQKLIDAVSQFFDSIGQKENKLINEQQQVLDKNDQLHTGMSAVVWC